MLGSVTCCAGAVCDPHRRASERSHEHSRDCGSLDVLLAADRQQPPQSGETTFWRFTTPMLCNITHLCEQDSFDRHSKNVEECAAYQAIMGCTKISFSLGIFSGSCSRGAVGISSPCQSLENGECLWSSRLANQGNCVLMGLQSVKGAKMSSWLQGATLCRCKTQ